MTDTNGPDPGYTKPGRRGMVHDADLDVWMDPATADYMENAAGRGIPGPALPRSKRGRSAPKPKATGSAARIADLAHQIAAEAQAMTSNAPTEAPPAVERAEEQTPVPAATPHELAVAEQGQP